jgi:hypothetical protein
MISSPPLASGSVEIIPLVVTLYAKIAVSGNIPSYFELYRSEETMFLSQTITLAVETVDSSTFKLCLYLTDRKGKRYSNCLGSSLTFGEPYMLQFAVAPIFMNQV